MAMPVTLPKLASTSKRSVNSSRRSPIMNSPTANRKKSPPITNVPTRVNRGEPIRALLRPPEDLSETSAPGPQASPSGTKPSIYVDVCEDKSERRVDGWRGGGRRMGVCLRPRKAEGASCVLSCVIRGILNAESGGS